MLKPEAIELSYYAMQKFEWVMAKFQNRFFESNPYYHIESNKEGILICNKERIASIKEIKGLLDFGVRLNKVINNT